MGVVSRRWVWLECIGVVSGWCKEVYRYPHISYPYSTYISSFLQHHPYFVPFKNVFHHSTDSISKDERGFPLTQYITNGRISRGGYTFTHFKHHHRVLRLISYSMSV